jgi:ABC-2 type transport system permease protein
MRALVSLALTEFRLALRDPLAVFWSIAFPALWLVLMAGIVRVPIPGLGREGISFASLMFPAAVSLVILISSFVGVPLTLTTYRENAVLRRLRVTPVKIPILVLGFSINQLAFTATGIAVLVVVGKVFFHVQVHGSWVTFGAVTLFGMVTFLAIGSAIGSVAGSFRSANIIVWSVFAPLLMFSELWMPISMLPAWLQPIARLLPLTPVNTILRDIAYGGPVEDLWRLGVMAAWFVVGCFVTVRFFRWE